MSIGAPIICSDIKENIYAVSNHAILFKKGMLFLSKQPREFIGKSGPDTGKRQKSPGKGPELVNWDNVVAEHIKLFKS